MSIKKSKRGTPREPIKVGARIVSPNCSASTEWMWARPISPDTAKLQNIPFFVQCMTLGDVVQFNPRTMMIVKVIEHCGRTLHAHFDPAETHEESVELWKQIVAHFQTHDIPVESMKDGYFSLAVPLDMNEDEFRSICVACPVSVQPYFD